MLRLSGGGALCIVGGSLLLGGSVSSEDAPYWCDCSALEIPVPATAADQEPPIGPESDQILAAAFSSSGEYFAITDERKRLVLFRVRPSWELLSVRGVSRRCTAITFSTDQSRVLLADKSGDVSSFPVTPPQGPRAPELGHLSMLLHLVVSRDGRHIITCDRDEKIRVSLWEAPHVISAFCLGHTEFVSQLLVLPGREDLLVSGSGDGTLRVWRYESGQEIQRWDLRDTPRPGDDTEVQRFAVSRLSCSPGGEHMAVLCDGVSGIFLFSVGGAAPVLAHTQYLRLPRAPLDVEFEDSGTLWVLSGVWETPIEVYTHTDGCWQLSPPGRRLKSLTQAVQENWEQLAAGSGTPGTRFSALYKAVFDNMASYLMKKQTRIQSEKRKLSHAQQDNTAKAQKT